MTAQDIAKTIPTIMAVRLLKENLKKNKKGGLIGLGVSNIVGTTMIQETAKYTSW